MSDIDDTTQEAAETADAQEWDSAFGKFDEEKGVKADDDSKNDKIVDDKKDYTNEELIELKRKEDEDAAAKLAEDRKNETPEEKAEREKKEAEDASKPKETEEEAKAARDRAQAVREARALQRDTMADAEAMEKDIVDTMFKDNDGKLYDADGDEIRTIEDVMALRNPATGQNFTEDQAGAWLLKATQHVQKEREEAIAMAKTYAEVNLTIKDEADTIKDKYGDFLADPKNAKLRDEIIQDYLETLVVDEGSGVVTKAPVSMVRFYDRALKPYMESQTTITSAEQARAQAEADAAKAKEEAAKAHRRTDREDIFARGDNGRSTLSKDQEEWADAEKSYYGKK